MIPFARSAYLMNLSQRSIGGPQSRMDIRAAPKPSAAWSSWGSRLNRGHRPVHRVRKFVEVGSGRIGYAMTAATLSDVSNGRKWNPDPSFNVADAILEDPDFASVLRAVLRDGHVIVLGAQGKGEMRNH